RPVGPTRGVRRRAGSQAPRRLHRRAPHLYRHAPGPAPDADRPAHAGRTGAVHPAGRRPGGRRHRGVPAAVGAVMSGDAVTGTNSEAAHEREDRPMRRLQGKVALITGAARGQGAVEAERFVSEGAAVVVTDILDDDGEKLVATLGERASYRHL